MQLKKTKEFTKFCVDTSDFMCVNEHIFRCFNDWKDLSSCYLNYISTLTTSHPSKNYCQANFHQFCVYYVAL